MTRWTLRILETAAHMEAVETLQRLVWPGNETEIVPAHMLLAAAHNGGLVVGAYAGLNARAFSAEMETGLNDNDILAPSDPPTDEQLMVGFVFGFPGLYPTSNGLRVKHCSHMLGVHPDYRDQGVGFGLKRAQWQMVRHQGLDRITWTFDPLLSRNAYLNIARLGAISNSYRRDEYGNLDDELNAGLPTDRFQVDWWVNSARVSRRLSSRPRLQLDLAHFLAAGSKIINPTSSRADGLPQPAPHMVVSEIRQPENSEDSEVALLMLEIPSDFQVLRRADAGLALAWRMHTRELFEELFARGYLVTDFIYLPGTNPRSFYVLSHGESTL